MGHLGERHHRPPFARSRISLPERRLDRGEEAAARRVFHKDESARSQLLRHAFLRVRALELLKFGKYNSPPVFRNGKASAEVLKGSRSANRDYDVRSEEIARK